MEKRSRWIAVIVALASATSFAIAVQSAWWVAFGETAVGPFGMRSCVGGDCSDRDLATWLSGNDLWLRSAVATRAAGYIAMFVLLMFAGAIAAKREPKILARGVISAIVTALAVGAYFALAVPSMDGLSMSYGVALYAVGIVLGVIAVVMFLRRRA